MNTTTTIWDQLRHIVIGLVVVLTLLGIGVWYLPLIRQNEEMRKEILRLDGEVGSETDKARALKALIESQRDPKAVERLARERLGYAKPNETVVRFESAPSSKSY